MAAKVNLFFSVASIRLTGFTIWSSELGPDRQGAEKNVSADLSEGPDRPAVAIRTLAYPSVNSARPHHREL
jgi:hypothetical protein